MFLFSNQSIKYLLYNSLEMFIRKESMNKFLNTVINRIETGIFHNDVKRLLK